MARENVFEWRPWSTRRFVFSGLVAALTFATAFVAGSGIIATTGIPATGGVANIFTSVFILVLSFRIVRTRFFGLLVMPIVFALAIPTPIGGPVGPLKLLTGVAIGLVFDSTVLFGSGRRASVVLGAGFASTASLLSVYLTLWLLEIPAIDKLRPLLIPLLLFQGAVGLFAAWLADSVYTKRVSTWPAVRRFNDGD